MRFAVDLYADFALVRPYSLVDYKVQGHDFEEAKSVLRKRNYYYAYGMSTKVKTEIAYKKFSAGISYSQNDFYSIDEGEYDLSPEGVTNHLSLKDNRRTLSIWFAYNFTDRVKLKLAADLIMRKGTITNDNNIFSRTEKVDVLSGANIEYRFHGL